MKRVSTRGRLGAGVVAAALMGLATAPAWSTEYISGEEWPAIQRGIQITQYSKLARIVNELDRTPGSSIVILHPGGAAGSNWAADIHDWFVALGVPSRFITMRPGSGVPGALGLEVEKQGDHQQ